MIESLHGIHETITYHEMPGVKLFLNTETESYPVHWHTALEIIMPYENTYTVIINKEKHTINEGEIFLTAPGTLHQLVAPTSGKRMILLFDFSLLCTVKGMSSLLHTIQPFTLITDNSSPELRQELASILDQIVCEYKHPKPYCEASILSLLINFFVTLGRDLMHAENKFPGITNSKQHEYIEKFMMICNYITEHCTENLTVDELAVIAGFSKFHFIRLFKQFTNVTCYEYLIQKRIEYAERLLIEPDISITEIAMRSGFGSLSTFNRVFKATKNCTPTEYKKLNTHSTT